jgi:hypothetical protein
MDRVQKPRNSEEYSYITWSKLTNSIPSAKHIQLLDSRGFRRWCTLNAGQGWDTQWLWIFSYTPHIHLLAYSITVATALAEQRIAIVWQRMMNENDAEGSAGDLM